MIQNFIQYLDLRIYKYRVVFAHEFTNSLEFQQNFWNADVVRSQITQQLLRSNSQSENKLKLLKDKLT